MNHENTETRLIKSAREGDRVAFDALMARVEHRVAAFIRSRIRATFRDRLDVDEIVQDTFVRAFQSVSGFHGDELEPFVRWLLGVARVAVIKAVNRTAKAELELAADPADSGVSPSRAMQREDRFHRLQRALDGLSPDHREVVYLSRIERLPMKEVAKRMGRSVDAVKKLFSRALEKLRERVNETGSLHLPHRKLQRRGDHDER